MSRVRFQQKCALCKKNMVQMFSSRQFPVCTPCQMKQLDEPITEPEYQALFNIPKELYEQSSFLRSIKENYIRFGSLTDKQKEVFKRVAKEMKEGKKEEKVDTSPEPLPTAKNTTQKRKSSSSGQKSNKSP